MPEWEEDMVDALLSEKGTRQCTQSNDYLPNLKYIFVSPMRRAVLTAHLLFKDHPNLTSGQVKVMVDPDLREGLKDSCTVPLSGVQDTLNWIRNMFSVDG